MSEALEAVKYNIGIYYGDFVFLCIAAVAFIYLAITSKELRGKLLFPIGLILFCVVNPILYKYVYYDLIYWRLFWTMPDAIIIALAVTKFVKERKSNVIKLAALTVAVCGIVALGKNAFKESTYEAAQNWYKLDSEAIEICDIMFTQNEQVKCIMPSSLYSEVRQYEGSIQMMYGRDAEMYIFENLSTINDVSAQMLSENPNYNTVLAMTSFYGYNFIVVEQGKDIEDVLLKKYGYSRLATTDKYIVYYCDEFYCDEGDWIITQYGYEGKSQRTFYTLEDKEGHLIIVDGGNEWDNKVYKVIMDHGGRVDAWIITTPKRENVGAFNDIATNHPEIVIDQVYTVEVNYDRYKETAKEYDNFEDFQIFYDITQNMNNVNYVQESDCVELFGLTIDILNAWDEETDKYKNKLTSYGSMCFVVKGDTESMLFGGEVTGDVGDKLLTEYKEELGVNYMQVAHRGYNGLDLDFYEEITPEIVFIDQSLSYVEANESEDKLTQIQQIIDIYENKNVQINMFDIAPNKVILK